MTKTPDNVNGSGSDTTFDEIKSVVDRIADGRLLNVIERVPSDGALPFEQKSHDLMMKSVDRVAQEWIEVMVALRNNSQVVEEMVIEQAGKVKSELTKLHLLGAQAMREAQRGHEVLQNLGEELNAILTGESAPAH